MKKKFNLNFLLRIPDSLSEKFHEKTKLKFINKSTYEKNWPKEWKTVYYKGYSRLDEIILPKPSLSSNLSLKKALVGRVSTRNFSKKPLSLAKISAILKFGAGLNASFRRFYPSAGARYPLEVYVISINSELPPGIYHYYLKNHSLEKILNIKKLDFESYFNQKEFKNSGVIILTTAVFTRNTTKYGDRGYRHILAESGHMAQNLYILSSALNIGICSLGGYLDDDLNRLIDVDGVEESVIYVLAVGEKASD